MTEKIRLGGMALGNGVLVHGPRHWACAVRDASGELKVASGLKPIRSAEIENPFIVAPAKIAEVFALLPVIRRALPEAELPFQRRRVTAAMFASAAVMRNLRRSGLNRFAQEFLGALLALGPTAVALRGSSLAAYHGAEHISIGSYELDAPATREHERCGSHLVGPLLVTTAVASVAASQAPRELRPLARLGATVGAMGASVRIFGWMLTHPENPAARAMAWPGRELQSRFVTKEPTSEQLEVANAALDECLRLETEIPS